MPGPMHVANIPHQERDIAVSRVWPRSVLSGYQQRAHGFLPRTFDDRGVHFRDTDIGLECECERAHWTLPEGR